MSQSDLTPPPSVGRPRRPLILWAVAAASIAIFAWNMLQRHDQPDTPGEMQLSHLIMLGVWGGLGLVYAWMRWRPRKPYDAVAVRPKAEAFQAKRWRLLLVFAGYIGFMLTPLGAYEALHLRQAATVIDRLFDLVLFVGPCALALGLMTSGIYSKQWGRVVDDELTVSHRARAFSTGFAVALVAGAGGVATILFQPAWAPATLPLVIGLGVAASATRFALLERAAQVAGG
jgi:hypothetical protein